MDVELLNYWDDSERRTKYGDDLVVLYDFERARYNEAQRVDAFALVEQHVAGRPVTDGEVDGEGTQTAVTGQSRQPSLASLNAECSLKTTRLRWTQMSARMSDGQ